METKTVRFKVRYLGDKTPTYSIEEVDVEKDSTEKEIDEQIKWYYIRYIVTEKVVETYPYEIL